MVVVRQVTAPHRWSAAGFHLTTGFDAGTIQRAASRLSELPGLLLGCRSFRAAECGGADADAIATAAARLHGNEQLVAFAARSEAPEPPKCFLL